MGDKLLTLKEVASWLGVSERTVHNLMSAEKIKGVKVGKNWRFEPETIRAYLQRPIKEAQS